MLEGRPERVAVIDVGTNSVKFRVTERDAGGPWRPVVDRAEVTRLGEGIDETGDIAQAAIDRTVAAITPMVEEARSLGVMAIIAVGTAGLRRAGNRDSMLAAAREEAGIVIRVISGEEEARLAFLATTASLGLGDEPIVVFDTGGGSSQFTFGEGDHVSESFSVNVGAVRYTERYGLDGAVSNEVLREAMKAIAEEYKAKGDPNVSLEVTAGIVDRRRGLDAARFRLKLEQMTHIDPSVGGGISEVHARPPSRRRHTRRRAGPAVCCRVHARSRG
jgi:exopolyphosphatase/guanosine-5'-triphosphate,3'-diphosphate pyrophosphatase